MKVIKRDGLHVNFDKFKIVDAVSAAFRAVDGGVSEYAMVKAGNIADYVEDQARLADHDFTIEEIQNMVERGLQSTKRKDVAREYIIYREDRNRERLKRSELIKEVGKKLQAMNVANQNANVDEYSFGGRKGEAADVIFKQYALENTMSETTKYNHINNISYTHDLNSQSVGMHNCLSIPFDPLLANGFKTRQTDIRPAKSVSSALQLIAVVKQLQSLQQFGGVSATHLDWTLAPYVKKSFMKHYLVAYLKSTEEFYRLNLFDLLFVVYIDNASVVRNKLDDWIDENKAKYLKEMNLTEEDFYLDNKDGLDSKLYQSALYDTIIEIKQGVEGLYHNLNTLQSRSGNQLPFTSINYGTCTSTEGRLVTRALLETLINGIGTNHKTSIFPCGIFQNKKGVNQEPGEPNYDLFRLALQATARRDYPNYANCDWSGNAGYDPDDPRTYFSTMGCRTANGWDANGFGQLKDGRGNIAPATIILPTVAMIAWEEFRKNHEGYQLLDYTDDNQETIEIFMSLLDKYIYETKEGLVDRFELIASQPADAASFMYDNNTMVGYIPERGIRSALCHGTLAVG